MTNNDKKKILNIPSNMGNVNQNCTEIHLGKITRKTNVWWGKNPQTQ